MCRWEDNIKTDLKIVGVWTRVCLGLIKENERLGQLCFLRTVDLAHY
jgi:hypothetical protein